MGMMLFLSPKQQCESTEGINLPGTLVQNQFFSIEKSKLVFAFGFHIIWFDMHTVYVPLSVTV